MYLILDGENDVMDQDQMSSNKNYIDVDIQPKLHKTPTRKAHRALVRLISTSILQINQSCGKKLKLFIQSDVNEFTPPRVRAVFSPLASKVPSLPQSPLFMSPVVRKRKSRPSALGRDVTIMQPITEAALPTDSPQQSRLPMECATPPQLFSATLGGVLFLV